MLKTVRRARGNRGLVLDRKTKREGPLSSRDCDSGRGEERRVGFPRVKVTIGVMSWTFAWSSGSGRQYLRWQGSGRDVCGAGSGALSVIAAISAPITPSIDKRRGGESGFQVSNALSCCRA